MKNKKQFILHILLFLIISSSIFASSNSSGTIDYTQNGAESSYDYTFSKISKPEMEKVSIYYPTHATSEVLNNVPAFKMGSANFKVNDNINQFSIVQHNIEYYTVAYISSDTTDLYSGNRNNLDTVTLYEKVSYYNYDGLKQIEWIKPTGYYDSSFEQVVGGSINIDYYYVVDEPSNFTDEKDLYIYVKYTWDNAQNVYYRLINNYTSPFGSNLYDTVLGENETFPVGSIPKSYSIDAKTLNVTITKIYESNDNTFFNNNTNDYYKLVLNPQQNGVSLNEDYTVGLTLSSAHNFNLYLDNKSSPATNEIIPYKLYFKYGNSGSKLLAIGGKKLIINGINSGNSNIYDNTIYLTTQTQITNEPVEGVYRDTIYLNFITDDIVGDSSYTINL